MIVKIFMDKSPEVESWDLHAPPVEFHEEVEGLQVVRKIPGKARLSIGFERHAQPGGQDRGEYGIWCAYEYPLRPQHDISFPLLTRSLGQFDMENEDFALDAFLGYLESVGGHVYVDGEEWITKTEDCHVEP